MVRLPYWPVTVKPPDGLLSVLPLKPTTWLTAASSAPLTSAPAPPAPPVVPSPVMTLPVTGVNTPSTALSASLLAVGASSLMTTWRLPVPTSPVASVADTTNSGPLTVSSSPCTLCVSTLSLSV
ncbi:hypothetical protein D3C84_780290 [compost metagenome]